jgi:polyisoprenoid-binding protein YceI
VKIQSLLSAVLVFVLQVGCKKDKTNIQSYRIDNVASKIEWKGSATDHFHVGSFRVEGNFKADDNGRLQSGDFVIPIASIQNYDLPDEPKEQLLAHLKSPDFFNVALHPEATFSITSVASYEGTDPTAVEGANYLITGNFSMIGQTHSLSFPAKVVTEKSGLHTKAAFKLNRLQWGMTSYNDPTEALYILPEVEIKLDIVSDRQ